jgi:aconitate hydratase
MDARSIAATAVNGGELTSAAQLDVKYSKPEYSFEKKIYENRIYNGFNRPKKDVEIKLGPNIKDWPEFEKLNEVLILKVVSVFKEDVITTDDLLPSDASNLRSNPYMLADHTLIMKDSTYVEKAKEVKKIDDKRQKGIINDEIQNLIEKCKSEIKNLKNLDYKNISIGSVIYANRIGDGSSREQAASSQKVLGAWANIAEEYTTKRYASNVKNWGMLPLLVEEKLDLKPGDFVILPKAREELLEDKNLINGYLIRDDIKEMNFKLLPSSKEERKIMADGGLLNHYKLKKEKNS